MMMDYNRWGLKLIDGRWVDENGNVVSNEGIVDRQAQYTEKAQQGENPPSLMSIDDILGQFGYDQYDNRFQSAYDDYFNSMSYDDRATSGLMSPEKMRLLGLSRMKQRTNDPTTVTSLTTPSTPTQQNTNRMETDPEDRWGQGSNNRWSGIKPIHAMQPAPANDPNNRYNQTRQKTFAGTF